MANQVLNGFRPWGTLSGVPLPSPIIREVANNYATGIFKYDFVSVVSDGTVAASASGDAAKFLGVAVGFYVYTSPLGQAAGRRPVPYLPANTTFTPTTVGSPNASWVEIIPATGDVIFEVCANDGTTVTTVAAGVSIINENCDLAAGSGGDTTTGLSSMVLNISSHNTTSKNFRVIGITNYPNTSGGGPFVGNDVTLTNARYLVTLNQGFLPPYTTSGI
jgi:hypothetical protein